MALIPSRAEIKVNGELLPTRPRAAIQTGGIERTAVTTDQPKIDHSEEIVPGRVSTTVVYRPGLDVVALRNLTGAVVTYRALPNGPTWQINDAYTQSIGDIAAGEFDLVLEGDPAQLTAS